MSHHHSFTITLKNNATEQEGIEYLMLMDNRFILPDKSGKKEIIKALDLPNNKSRAFDLIYVHNPTISSNRAIIEEIDSLTLIELKTTKKKLVNNPAGFFFGATESEFELAKRLGDKYKFCFVCLHPEARSYKLLTLSELEPLIKTKRTQYQINL